MAGSKLCRQQGPHVCHQLTMSGMHLQVMTMVLEPQCRSKYTCASGNLEPLSHTTESCSMAVLILA